MCDTRFAPVLEKAPVLPLPLLETPPLLVGRSAEPMDAPSTGVPRSLSSNWSRGRCIVLFPVPPTTVNDANRQ